MHLQSEGDSLLHDGICSKLPASQVLPEVSKNMEVAGTHNDISTHDWLWCCSWEVRDHTPDCTNFTSSDFHLHQFLLCCDIQTFVPWRNICLNVHGNYVESDVHNPLPICHVCIKARMKFWASLLPYFKKLIYNVTSTYVNEKLILQEVWLWIIYWKAQIYKHHNTNLSLKYQRTPKKNTNFNHWNQNGPEVLSLLLTNLKSHDLTTSIKTMKTLNGHRLVGSHPV